MEARRHFVIVQAGGRGSRLRHHTWNKPKCLVSIHGKPILYHLFDRFPGASFIVIGDYLYEQLEAYIGLNPPVNSISLVKAKGSGTCAGIAEALQAVPSGSEVTLVWSDLYFKIAPDRPDSRHPIIYTTSAFACRWSLDSEGVLRERTSDQQGVPGLFHFNAPEDLSSVPLEGEFVRWWSEKIRRFSVVHHDEVEELGDFAAIEKLNDREGFSRFFNDVRIDEETVTKTVVDPKFESLQQNEVAWYRAVNQLGFKRIPRLLGEKPLRLQRIKGSHAFQLADMTTRERRAVMMNYIDALESLHRLEQVVTRGEDANAVYVDKAKQRVMSVARIIPGMDSKTVTVNGRKSRNPFAMDCPTFWEEVSQVLTPKFFCPIHGDPTFSNSLVDQNLSVWFIDPRGYFKDPGIHGDPLYDFAKLYYSAVGSYDSFNRRKFKLYVDGSSVEVLMEDNSFASITRDIFREYFDSDLQKIRIIHGLIWLSLTGYVRDDVDSIIGAFFLGLYWLEEGLQA